MTGYRTRRRCWVNMKGEENPSTRNEMPYAHASAPTTFAMMIHQENARHNDDMLEEVKRLHSLTSLLTREKTELQQVVWNADAAARASADYVKQLLQQTEHAHARTRFLEEVCKNKNIEIGRLAKRRSEEDRATRMAELLAKNSELVCRADAAEEMVERQRNDIHYLNADVYALETKYTSLKQAVANQTSLPFPIPHSPLHEEETLHVWLPDDNGWEKVKMPFSDS